MKKNYFGYLVVILIIVSFFISTAVSIDSLQTVMSSHEESYAKVIASSIYDNLNKELQRPLNVGQTMAHDSFLISLLKQESELSDTEMEEAMQEYLCSLTDGMGITSAFVVSADSLKYYTQAGLNKVVDPQNDEYDIWYSLFLEQNIDYDFDIDIDENHQDEWRVFVDNRIEDENGNLLGVCGVSVVVDELQKELLEAQDEYQVRITLVDDDGQVQIDVDNINIENTVLKDLDLDKSQPDYAYQKVNEGYVITKYMEGLGLYLVIGSDNPNLSVSFEDMISDTVVTMFAILTLLVLVVILVLKRGNHATVIQAKTSGLISLSNIYVSMHLIDIENDRIVEIKSNEIINSFIDKKTQTASQQLHNAMAGMTSESYREGILQFVDLSTLPKRLKGNRTLSYEFMGKRNGWCRARFIVEGNDLEHVSHVIYAVEVIDKEKRREKELLKLSQTDQLTGIYNRGYGEKEIAECLLKKQSGMMLLLDVDNFKMVNDTYGHDVGDKVLIAIARALEDVFGEDDIIMRLGGDEFSVYTSEIDNEEDGKERIEELFGIVETIELPELKGETIHISVGVSLYDGNKRISFGEIYKQVDMMLYESKKVKGSRCTFYHEVQEV